MIQADKWVRVYLKTENAISVYGQMVYSYNGQGIVKIKDWNGQKIIPESSILYVEEVKP